MASEHGATWAAGCGSGDAGQSNHSSTWSWLTLECLMRSLQDCVGQSHCYRGSHPRTEGVCRCPMGQNLCVQGPTWWNRKQVPGRLRDYVRGSCKVRTLEEWDLPWKDEGNMPFWSRLPLAVLTLVDSRRKKSYPFCYTEAEANMGLF